MSQHLSTRAAVGGAALLMTLAGCSTGEHSAAATGADFPLTLWNCGSEIHLDHRPERIVMIGNDTLADLQALDAVDRVVAKTVPALPELYDEATIAALDRVPSLSTQRNATGGSVVTLESIIALDPDLVISPESNVDRAGLAAAGIPLYSRAAFCTTPPDSTRGPASYDRIWDGLNELGALLGTTDTAKTVAAEGKSALPTSTPVRATGAALYVGGNGALYAYGAGSMVTPVFGSAGLRNVYADQSDRVFDVSAEDLAARAPQTLVLLYDTGTAAEIVARFRATPAAALLAPNTHIVGLPFPYTDPPSIMTAAGGAVLQSALDTQ